MKHDPETTTSPSMKDQPTPSNTTDRREIMIDLLSSLVAAVSLLKRGSKKAAPSDCMFDAMVADYEKAIERGRAAMKEIDHVERELDPDDWTHMDEAPRDGRMIQVFVPRKHNLPGYITQCSYHPDAGFCVDELREPVMWRNAR